MPPEIKNLLSEFLQSPLFKVFILGIFFIIGVTTILMFNLPKDNLIEQISEEVIKIETGIDFDFTPHIGEK